MQRKAIVRRSAFTFTELAIAAVVVAILTVSAWPDREADDQARLDSALTKLEADIEYARSVSLASPADPAVIKVSLDNDRYWIAKMSAPDTPITNPNTRKPYITQFGKAGESSFRDINVSADSFGDQHTLTFNSNGSIKSDSSVGMEFQLGKRKSSLTISPSAASTRKAVGDLASLVSNVVAEVADSVDGGEEEDDGLIGGILGKLGL